MELNPKEWNPTSGCPFRYNEIDRLRELAILISSTFRSLGTQIQMSSQIAFGNPFGQILPSNGGCIAKSKAGHPGGKRFLRFFPLALPWRLLYIRIRILYSYSEGALRTRMPQVPPQNSAHPSNKRGYGGTPAPG